MCALTWWGFSGLYAEPSADPRPPSSAGPAVAPMTHWVSVLKVLRAKLLLCSRRASLSALPICPSSHQRKEYWVNIHEKPYMSSELNPTEPGLSQTSWIIKLAAVISSSLPCIFQNPFFTFKHKDRSYFRCLALNGLFYSSCCDISVTSQSDGFYWSADKQSHRNEEPNEPRNTA